MYKLAPSFDDQSSDSVEKVPLVGRSPKLSSRTEAFPCEYGTRITSPLFSYAKAISPQ